MSNHSLPARGSNPPFSHKSVVSIMHEQNNICTKTLIWAVVSRSHGELSANEMEGKITLNDDKNNNYYSIMLHWIWSDR